MLKVIINSYSKLLKADNINIPMERSLVKSKATRRNTSMIITTIFFAIFGILATSKQFSDAKRFVHQILEDKLK